MSSPICMSLLILLIFSIITSVSSFNGYQKKVQVPIHRHPWSIPRAGSSEIALDGKEEETEGEDGEELEDQVDEDKSRVDEKEEDEDKAEAEDDEEDDEDDDGAASDDPFAGAFSTTPVSITFKTNLGSALVDASLELLVSRSRNVESVKNNLSRMLPGRPPIESLRIISDGTLLRDEQLIDELIDDDDEDEDDDDDEKQDSLTLTLDMVPPVDPKFATQMRVIDDMTTSEILDAYAANVASMYLNGQSMLEQSEEEGFIAMKLRQGAQEVREQLVSTFPDKALELLEEPTPPSTEIIEQRRGQRYRAGKGGAKTNLKRTIQTNLNINWGDTIRNFLLFLFFGIFGGRNTISRNLLLLGAPMCFVLQARPVKIILKQAFYMCARPPGILLSLLPAPQQAILDFDHDEAMDTLYGETKPISSGEREDDDEDDDEDDYDDEDDEDDDED